MCFKDEFGHSYGWNNCYIGMAMTICFPLMIAIGIHRNAKALEASEGTKRSWCTFIVQNSQQRQVCNERIALWMQLQNEDMVSLLEIKVYKGQCYSKAKRNVIL